MNVVLIGDALNYEDKLEESLKEKGINLFKKNDFTELTTHLQSNYKNTDLLIIAYSDEVECINSILSIQSKYLFKDIPFIVVGNKKLVMKGLALGAKDYIVIPCNVDESISRIINAIGTSVYNVNKKNSKTIVQMSFNDYFMSEIKRAERGNYDLSIIFLSIIPKNNSGFDDFSLYNIIKELSIAVHSKLRSTDTIIKYGSLNILAFLPFTSRDNATAVLDKINSIYNINVAKDDSINYDLVSTIVSFPDSGATPEDLLYNAEQILGQKIQERS